MSEKVDRVIQEPYLAPGEFMETTCLDILLNLVPKIYSILGLGHNFELILISLSKVMCPLLEQPVLCIAFFCACAQTAPWN